MDNGECSYRRFLDGEDEGLILIIKDYKDGLILYLNSYVNNIYIAEDLMEETFYKIAVKKPKFASKSSFKTWLYTIGRNVAIDYLRHNSKIAMSSIDDMLINKTVLPKTLKYLSRYAFHSSGWLWYEGTQDEFSSIKIIENQSLTAIEWINNNREEHLVAISGVTYNYTFQ